MATALELTREEWERYDPAGAVAARREREAAALEARHAQGREVARRAAIVLYEQFGAKEVYLFGSLLYEEALTLWSDIDLAVVGIPPTDYFEAVAAIEKLDAEFEIDLVALEDCHEGVQATIKRDGVLL